MATPILGSPLVAARGAACWAASRGAPLWWCDLTDLYWDAGIRSHTGVRPDVAFAQACKETGFGTFGRAVTRGHQNPCGLKVPQPVGPDDNPDDHQRFASWEMGVRAHMEHLALYAGAPGFPLLYAKRSPTRWEGATADPRHFSFVYGVSPNVEDLGGEVPSDSQPDWAPSPDYGVSIVHDYLNPLITFTWG